MCREHDQDHDDEMYTLKALKDKPQTQAKQNKFRSNNYKISLLGSGQLSVRKRLRRVEKKIMHFLVLEKRGSGLSTK